MNATFNKYKARECRSLVHPVELAQFSISDRVDLNRKKIRKATKKKSLLGNTPGCCLMLVKLNLRPYFQTNVVCSYKMCGVLFNRHAVILPSAHQSNTITCDSLSTRK
jgi:hypothetical protein